MGKMIYLDNAATTKTAPEVVQGNAATYFQNIMATRPVFMICRQEQRGNHQRKRADRRSSWSKKEEIYSTAGGSSPITGL